ncbi:MAG: DNA primase [Candidatus Dadabacteria bacterium]|nr:MAG: DNA primase [Candidatus Dadabacteria bacterium]
MISQETINQIRDKADILEVIGENVSLKRQGRNYVGLCPFHQEKTPSFHVRVDDNYYHCFGCGASGNIISYVMEVKGVSFPEAVEELASRFGIEVKREGEYLKDRNFAGRNKIYSLNMLAYRYFREQLKKAPDEVIDYYRKRRLGREAVNTFRLGFAPDSWEGLVSYMRSLDVSDDLMVQAGLARRRDDGRLYDYFRGRIIFPIWLDKRRIAGFGGRIIPVLFDADKLERLPKYLNSSETAAYSKSNILYGLPQALSSIRQTQSAYIVEGYMDVIALWQVGIKNVVATCGTALTEKHVKRLSTLVRSVTVLFDGDRAGREAAGKSFVSFRNSGLDAKAVFLPAGLDPDDLAASQGAQTETFLNSLERHSLLDCLIDNYLMSFNVTDVKELGAATKGKLCESIAAELGDVTNSIERDELIKRAAFRLLVDPKDFKSLIGKLGVVNKSEFAQVESEEEQAGEINGVVSVLDLPRVDRELLRSAMVLKDSLPERILSDSELLRGIHGSTRLFIEGLYQVMDSSSSDSQKKECLLELLAEFGESWIRLWKEAYQMASDPEVDFERAFRECTRSIKKMLAREDITRIDAQIRDCESEEEKKRLVEEKVALTCKMQAI